MRVFGFDGFPNGEKGSGEPTLPISGQSEAKARALSQMSSVAQLRISSLILVQKMVVFSFVEYVLFY